jgi:hypothetical protein
MPITIARRPNLQPQDPQNGLQSSLHNAYYATRLGLGSLGAVLLLVACPAPRAAIDAGLVEAPIDAGVDAGSPADSEAATRIAEPAELKFELLAALRDGGVEPVAISALRGELEPASALVLLLESALADYRVRLLDAQEQIPPSDDEAIELDGGLSYRIGLAGPLKPGRSYALTVEAELGTDITDARGNRFHDLRVDLKVRGEPEPEKPPGRPGKRRKP